MLGNLELISSFLLLCFLTLQWWDGIKTTNVFGHPPSLIAECSDQAKSKFTELLEGMGTRFHLV